MRDFNSSDLVDPKAVHMVRFVVRNSSRIHQEWISDMDIDGPTFVPKSGHFFY